MKRLRACLLFSTVAVLGWTASTGAQSGAQSSAQSSARAREAQLLPVVPPEGGVFGACIPALRRVPRGTGEVELHWSVRPTMDLDSLSYAIELPAGATLIQGSTTGSADPTGGTRTSGMIAIDLGTGSGFRECVLTATASFLVDGPAGPMPETVLDEAAVFWGVPAPPLPVISTPLPGGASQNVAVVPSTTR